MISRALAHYPFVYWSVAALFIFLFFFLGVMLLVLWPGAREKYQPVAHLPFKEESSD